MKYTTKKYPKQLVHTTGLQVYTFPFEQEHEFSGAFEYEANSLPGSSILRRSRKANDV